MRPSGYSANTDTDSKTAPATKFGAQFALFAAALLFISCASTANLYRPIDAEVERGDFDSALAVLENGEQKIYPSGAEILFYLDRGVLEYYAGRYAESATDFETAEGLILEAYTKSVSQNIASYIINDNTRDYAGEDYEDLYINIFAALDYYHSGDYQGALVEIRKLTAKLEYLAVKYAKDAERVEEYARSQAAGVSLPSTEQGNFYNSALARFLSAIFYRGSGSPDDARIDFLRLSEAWIASPSVYSGSFPAPLEMSGSPGRESNGELDIPAGQARLNILGFSGLCPVKVEQKVHVFFPFLYVPDATITVPALQARPSVITGITVRIASAGGEQYLDLYVLENMGAVMEAAFSRRYNIIVIKTFVRTVIKYLVAEIAGHAAAERSDSRLAGFLAARVAKAFADVSESADTRSSRYFPSVAWAGGVNLPPGTYRVTVDFYAGRRLVDSVPHESVTVEEGRTNLVEAFSFR
jgi:hypothetical protein